MTSLSRVRAKNSAHLCDLLILAEEPTEPVVSLDVAGIGCRAVGEWS